MEATQAPKQGQTPHANRGEAEQATADGTPTQLIEDLLKRLGTRAVFGEPIEKGDLTIIPVAEVRTGFGFGSGQGSTVQASEDQPAGSGSGSGGGAGARVTPWGYIRIADGKVHFEPISNVTRMVLAGMGLTAWITFLLSKVLQRSV